MGCYSYAYRPKRIHDILFAVGIVITFVSCSFADDSLQADDRWKLEPAGQAWMEFYAPNDSNTFMYTGSESVLRFYGPSRFEFYLLVHMSTYAGYRISASGSGPRTPVDLLHERWQQALGATWKLAVPVHLFVIRDCNHQLDHLPGGPYLWSDAAAGVGTLPPFQRFFLKGGRTAEKPFFLWFFAGGPSIRTKGGSVWDYHSSVTSEGWARALVQKDVTYWLAADGYFESNIQGSTERPKLRHRIMTEVGLTLHSGNAGWRFYFGRRWRDTTFLWPSDQRNYFGFGYVF